MRKPLVAAENPFWQNLLGCLASVVVVPIFLALKLLTMPFEKPIQRTPEEVAGLLRKCLNDSATDGEIDYFISCEIADPDLEKIRIEVGSMFGPGWDTPKTRNRLQDLLQRVESARVD